MPSLFLPSCSCLDNFSGILHFSLHTFSVCHSLHFFDFNSSPSCIHSLSYCLIYFFFIPSHFFFLLLASFLPAFSHFIIRCIFVISTFSHSLSYSFIHSSFLLIHSSLDIYFILFSFPFDLIPSFILFSFFSTLSCFLFAFIHSPILSFIFYYIPLSFSFLSSLFF